MGFWERLRTGPRTLVLIIALAGAVIVGLLAMHSFNAHATGGSPSSHHAIDQHMDASAPANADAPCPECTDAQGHADMLAMACVLALLVAVLLALRPGSGLRWLSVEPRARHPESAPAARPEPPPPSRIALCISRT